MCILLNEMWRYIRGLLLGICITNYQRGLKDKTETQGDNVPVRTMSLDASLQV